MPCADNEVNGVPMCANQALLNEHGIAFGSFDILEDNDVRQGIKKYSDWPTFPQFYVDSKLIGGLDILVDMAEDAEESLAAELGL